MDSLQKAMNDRRSQGYRKALEEEQKMLEATKEKIRLLELSIQKRKEARG